MGGGTTRTVVLVGRVGNGKSATGNSILRMKAFASSYSFASVTRICQMQTTVLEDGSTLNVIDTPGLSYFSGENEVIGKEIVKCINMEHGINAVLLVLSTWSRFSREEESVMESLRTLFGSKLSEYMIVVFTGGDDLEENGVSLNDYLGRGCPEPLKEILQMCGNRCVLFDNRTADEHKKYEQLMALLSLVNVVVDLNGGKPYTDELFLELKKGAVKLWDQTVEDNSMEGYTKQEISELNEQIHKSYGEQLKRIVVFLFYSFILYYFFDSNQQAAQEKSNDEI